MRRRLLQIDRGILLMLLSSMTFALMGGFAKMLTSELPAVEVTFFRNIFGVVLVLGSLYYLPLNQKGGRPWLLFFRGAMGFCALLAYFYLMGHIPLGEAITYNKTSPLFVSFFAWLFLGERLGRNAIAALFIGFGGIIFIAQPFGMEGFDRNDYLGIFSGIGAALAYTSIRELRAYYDTRSIVLSFMLVGTVAPLLMMLYAGVMEVPQEWQWIVASYQQPTPKQWGYIVMVGLSATMSQYLMTKAYGLTKAGIVGTIGYSNIVFGIVIGVALGDSWPEGMTIFGIILIIVSGLLVALDKKDR